MIIDDCQHKLTQPLGLNEVTELSDRRLVWCRLIAKVNTYEIPYHCAVIEAVLGLRVRRVESLLQKVDAQHQFNPNRRATSLP